MPIQYPFVWADTLAFTAGGTSGQLLAFDTITVPAGQVFSETPVLLLYLSNGLQDLNPVGAVSFTFRFPDASTIPINGHGASPGFEAANPRFIEGGVLVCHFTLGITGTSTNMLVAALVDIPSVVETNFNPSSGLTPTLTSGSQTLGGVTSTTSSFSAVAAGEPFGHIAIARLAVTGFDFVNAQAVREPHNLTSVPTFQVGNIGTWTDIIMATSGERQVGMGLYVASGSGLSRSFSITNLTSITSGLGGGCVINSTDSVFLPFVPTKGRAYAQMVG